MSFTYNVVNWLPVYNEPTGILTVSKITDLIWTRHRLALPAAAATIGAHVAVMTILLTVYRDVVAPDSIRARKTRPSKVSTASRLVR